MIVRQTDNAYHLITQIEHASLCAEIGSYWGNKGFFYPEPLKSVMHAIEHHDDGWARYDAIPRLKTDTRQIVHFRSIPLDDHIELYWQGVQAVADDDPYAGLLVNRHAKNLYMMKLRSKRSLDLSDASGDYRARVLGIIQQLDAHFNDLRNSQLKSGIPLEYFKDKHINANYALMAFLDALSLYLCEGISETKTIVDAPLGYDGARTSITVKPIKGEHNKVSLSPWPFGADKFDVSLWYTSIGPSATKSDEALQRAVNQAKMQKEMIVLQK